LRELDPNNIEIRCYEVRLLSGVGKTPEAIKALKDILNSTAKKTYDPAQKSSRARMLER